MRHIIALILSVLLITLITVPAFALADPTSISLVTIDGVSVRVTRNNVETGDMTIIFEYNLYYSSPPTTPPASDSFMFRLYDTDGTTLLASVVPFVKYNAGYGRGCGSFYFTALTAPTWGSAYTLNISGSPAVFNPLPTPFNYTLSSGNYSGYTLKADNQVLVKTFVLGIATDMMNTYTGLVLSVASDSGTVLSGDGETYFKGCIPGLTSIAPTLFLTQSVVPTVTNLAYNQSLGTTYSTRSSMTDIRNGFTRIGAYLGTTGQNVAAILTILFCVGMLLFLTYKGWGVEPGMIASSIILTVAAVLLGDSMLTLRLIMGLLAAILLFNQLYLKRS